MGRNSEWCVHFHQTAGCVLPTWLVEGVNPHPLRHECGNLGIDADPDLLPGPAELLEGHNDVDALLAKA